MTVMTYSDMLKAARQLPLSDQVEMAEALLRNLRSALQSQSAEPAAEELIPLAGMSAGELRALAESVVAPGHQQQLETLLDKNRRGELSSDEQTRLDALLAEADQVALLKARACYTLETYGPSLETVA
jgi:hypothetical protein